MKKLNFTNSRITLLRESLKLSQKDFADKVGITQSALSQLEAGKSKLSLDSLQKISMIYDVNCNWLVNGDGAIFMNDLDTKKSKSPVEKIIITADIDGKSLIPLVSIDAHAGYVNGMSDIDFLKALDVYKIPGFENGNYRLFEITGDSMIPTLYPGEIVVSSHIESWENVENGSLCILVTEDGIIAKRTYFYEEERNLLILKSDNSKFKTYTVNLDDVLELWDVKAKITSVFASENLVNAKKIESLESDIKTIKSQMSKLAKGIGTRGKR